MELAAYRRSAESFLSELTGAYYRHYAGLHDEFEIEPIYERHSELFEFEPVRALRELAETAAPGSEEHRRLAMLLDFATEGFLGNATKQIEAELARREAGAEVTLDGERIGFRSSAVLQANTRRSWGLRARRSDPRRRAAREQIAPRVLRSCARTSGGVSRDRACRRPRRFLGTVSRWLGVSDTEEIVAYARAHRLVYLRRYAAKLAYELELRGAEASLAALAKRYTELLGGALQIDWPPETFLADVDPGFYCARYLRAWALETHLRAYLRERFGPAWFQSREAGQVLRTLWRQGQRTGPDELLDELTGKQLDFTVLLADLDLAGA